MFITPSNLASYLIIKGLIRAAHVVDGNLAILQIDRRNRNFKVDLGKGDGLFVKQVRAFTPDLIDSLRRESACYHLAGHSPGFASLRPYVPSLLGYDARRHILATSLLTARTLTEFHQSAPCFDARAGRLLGQALGAIHGKTRGTLSEPGDLVRFPRVRPWILAGLNSPELSAPSLADGPKRLVETLAQSPDMQRTLADLYEQWEIGCYIHGDLRWENVLISDKPLDGEGRIYVVDWELSDFGDPAWDVACVIVAYLFGSVVLGSLQNGATGSLADVGRALRDMNAAVPLLREFWKEYRLSTDIPESAAVTLCQRAMAFIGSRLLLLAFEMAGPLTPATLAAPLVFDLARAALTDPSFASRLIEMESQPLPVAENGCHGLRGPQEIETQTQTQRPEPVSDWR